MPYKSKRICSYPNCNKIINSTQSHCHEHKPQSWEIKREYNPFYSSAKWKRLSKRFRQANPLCVECKRKGRDQIGHHADHIKPIEQGGDPLDWNNLNALCIPCHSSKTAKEIRNK